VIPSNMILSKNGGMVTIYNHVRMTIVPSVFCFNSKLDRPSHYHKLGHHESEHMSKYLYSHVFQRSMQVSCMRLNFLSVRLGHTLQLVLLLDRVAVAASLGGVDELFSQAFGNALDVSEGGFTGTDREEGNSLVDSAKGRDIDCLTTDSTSRANAG
jgi:hypothetical protein